MTDLALILIVSVVGTLITVYACGYMKDYHKHHTEFADKRRKNTCKWRSAGIHHPFRWGITENMLIKNNISRILTTDVIFFAYFFSSLA